MAVLNVNLNSCDLSLEEGFSSILLLAREEKGLAGHRGGEQSLQNMTSLFVRGFDG